MANEFAELIKEEGKFIKVYLGKEVKADPFEENTNLVLINPIPVKCLITDLIASQIKWKMIGINADKAKELIIPKSKRPLMEISQEIEIEGDIYMGWRDNSGKMMIREQGDYIRVYVYIKIGAQ